MISTTMVATNMAAMTNCPNVLDIPVGSMAAVCTGGPTLGRCPSDG